MPKPCESWDTFVEALKDTGVLLTQAGNTVTTRSIRRQEVKRVAKTLGVPGNTPEELKGSFFKLGGSWTDSATGFWATFSKHRFVPCLTRRSR